MEEWKSVTINELLEVRPAKLTGCPDGDGDWIEPTGKNKLYEEHIETLVLSAFQQIFGHFHLIVCSREEAIFTAPDILAVDRLGRRFFFELKVGKGNTNELVAQALDYAVNLPNKILTNRIFEHLTVHLPIYHWGILNHETMKGKGRGKSKKLKNRTIDEFKAQPEYKELKLGKMGIDSDEFRKPYSEWLIQKKLDALRGYDSSKIRETFLCSITGVDLFDKKDGEIQIGDLRIKRFGHNLDVDTRFNLVFFAESFSFENQVEERKLLEALFLRRIPIHFFEYRIRRNQKRPNEFLFCWRERNDWIPKSSGGTKGKWDKADFFRRNASTLDEFANELAKVGLRATMTRDAYLIWKIKDDKRGHELLTVQWPLGTAQSHNFNKLELKEQLTQEQLKQLDSIGASRPNKDKYEWHLGSGLTAPQFVKRAVEVIK